MTVSTLIYSAVYYILHSAKPLFVGLFICLHLTSWILFPMSNNILLQILNTTIYKTQINKCSSIVHIQCFFENSAALCYNYKELHVCFENSAALWYNYNELFNMLQQKLFTALIVLYIKKSWHDSIYVHCQHKFCQLAGNPSETFFSKICMFLENLYLYIHLYVIA